MKKKLLLGILLGTIVTGNAQVLQTENFNSLTAGNVGSDLTGATAGQGGWYTQIASGGQNSDFTIVNEGGSHGNVIQITGASVATGTTDQTNNTRFAWMNGLDTAWENRTSGNDFIEVEFDFYAVSASTSTSLHRILVFNGDYSKTLGGFSYNAQTNILSGLIYYSQGTPQTTGTYNITLVTGGLFLEPDTWVRLGFSFDQATGKVRWKSNDLMINGTFTSSYIVGEEPAELDIMVIAGTGNTEASSSKFDNIVVRASANDSQLLSAEKVINASSELLIFPNPAKDIITVSNTKNILVNNVDIIDLNGRTVKSVKLDGVPEAQVNISDLSAGVYMMNISSDKGSVTKKIVKQ